MMHHHEKKERRGLLFAGQLIAWAVVMGVILLMVTGCKSSDDPETGPTYMDEPLHTLCKRCFDVPGMGHPTQG